MTLIKCKPIESVQFMTDHTNFDKLWQDYMKRKAQHEKRLEQNTKHKKEKR